MDLSLSSRFKNAWNAFRNRAPTMMSQNIGSGYSYRPDRFRLTRGNERSIVTSVYNRIALDVAAINIQHVQLDDEGRFLNVIKSGLNECLSLEANLDQTGRAFIQDVVMSMMDEGCVAIVPVDTDDDPDDTKGYQILSMRVGRIRDWYPRHVRVEVYNENTGRKQEIVVPKDTVAIVENPLYAVINEPNSTMQRLIRKLNLLDAVDEQSSSGKLDLIIQLPYVIKSEARRKQAEQRRKDIEQQLSGSKYGIAYTDGTERITQLNRYKVSVKSSKWKESTQKFMMNFLRYIFEIQDDLINRTLQNGPTQEFELHERGRIRPITSIQIRDRIVRHSLCDEVLLPEVRKHIIYDNCASIKGRGISQQRKRFEIHLHKYYQLYGNDGYILFGDFSKFYDNIIHEIAKRELLKLFNDDAFIDWLLTLIFKGFQIDVSYMSDEEYEACMTDTFNKLEYRNIPKEKLTGEKWMEKSVNIGDQLSQVIGIYYPYPIDNYVKYVRQQKFYGRYMDDWYIMNPSKEELEELLENVCKIAAELGIHINRKKTRIVKISSKYKFLQIKYTLTDTGKVIKRINPDRVTAMRRKLKKLAVKVENEEADYDNVENMFRGWMGGHYKLLSREQRKNLIQLYEDLFSKEITIVNKKLIVSDRSA